MRFQKEGIYIKFGGTTSNWSALRVIQGIAALFSIHGLTASPLFSYILETKLSCILYYLSRDPLTGFTSLTWVSVWIPVTPTR